MKGIQQRAIFEGTYPMYNLGRRKHIFYVSCYLVIAVLFLSIHSLNCTRITFASAWKSSEITMKLHGQ